MSAAKDTNQRKALLAAVTTGAGATEERCQLIGQVTQRCNPLRPEVWTPEHIAAAKEAHTCGEELCRVFVGAPLHWSQERVDAFDVAVNQKDWADLLERVDLDLLRAKKGNWSHWSATGQHFMGTEAAFLIWNRIWVEGRPALELLITAVDAESMPFLDVLIETTS
ncbi:hypothetical protein ASG87_01350 [Frateuria sp. Soil773]|uniref:hypothetical protein n=1 Tax=Frateuria sp. Soil773 TaxID=1736407 RepID=UPI0006FD8BF6|nr:hypothetical protein [Frateuria sp. Soil773]KRE90809.1 hypothetical protein ASG87_01350 [Frateuria sp. Soil773]